MHGAATGGVAEVECCGGARRLLDEQGKDGTTPLEIADGTKSAFRAWPHTAELFRTLLAAQAQQN